ncbi:response regulator transcription factor [Soonwooa sp.]|uniref:response regulator transcription factor n=1 Tax=Soonwooa sp. TaxID=1938592 RepID=UPI002631B326|nr:response regulator transcription factor [Soonwooa sp.]
MNNQAKILIVEDEVLIAIALKKMLEPDFLAEMAHDYDEAKMLLSHKLFDIALIDITLSGEKTGFDVANFINENIFIPFIFTTALTDNITLDKVKGAKPSAYLSKPIERVNLITAINLALANQEQSVRIEVGKSIYFVSVKDFLYAESSHIYTELFFKSRKNLVLRITMTQIEHFFPEKYFKRINRSISVNPQYISQIVNDKLYIEDKVFKMSKNF